MKTIKETQEWLLANRVNKQGNLDLSNLDFSDFDGCVDIAHMQVKHYLFQGSQKVGIDLYQSEQKVKGNLYQGCQEVGIDLYQSSHKVQGDLWQGSQEVKGDLIQNYQEVKGDLKQDTIINGKTKAQALREVEKLYE